MLTRPTETGTGYSLPPGAERLVHDLRNILTSVYGYAQLMQSMTADEKMLEAIAVIEAESRRCCDLVDHVLGPATTTTSTAKTPRSPR